MGIISKPDFDVLSRMIRHIDGTPDSSPTKPLHRLREMRVAKGLSVGQMAIRLRVSPAEIWAQEDPEYDPSLTEIRRWSQALDVPMHELLIENQNQMDLVCVTSHQLSKMTVLAGNMQTDSCADSATMNLLSRLTQQLDELRSARHA